MKNGGVVTGEACRDGHGYSLLDTWKLGYWTVIGGYLKTRRGMSESWKKISRARDSERLEKRSQIGETAVTAHCHGVSGASLPSPTRGCCSIGCQRAPPCCQPCRSSTAKFETAFVRSKEIGVLPLIHLLPIKTPCCHARNNLCVTISDCGSML